MIFYCISFVYEREDSRRQFFLLELTMNSLTHWHLLFFFYLQFYSAGGLVTAVAPVVIKGNGLWVGWPGIHMNGPLDRIPESDPEDQTPTAGLRSEQVIDDQL